MGGTASSTEATDRNFWVKYRIAVLNQKHPESTEWKESAICTKTWNNSVLQFIKVSAMVDHDAGYLIKDSLVLACEVLDCCPWCEVRKKRDGLIGTRGGVLWMVAGHDMWCLLCACCDDVWSIPPTPIDDNLDLASRHSLVSWTCMPRTMAPA